MSSEQTKSRSQEAQKIDLRGLVCPEPVLRAKKLLDDKSVSAVEATVDSEINVNNLQRLARSLKIRMTSEIEGDHFKVRLDRVDGVDRVDRVDAAAVPETTGRSGSALGAQSAHHHATNAEAKQTSRRTATSETPEVGTVVFLTKDAFGEGDRDFSVNLINIFLQTMYEAGHRPRAILMANSGVKLMAKDASTLKVLNDFKEAGCEVLACGLCVEFYGLKDQIPKEQITNMFSIVEYMFAADRILTP